MLVNGGTVTVAGAVSVQNITLSSPYYSGTLNGSGVLTVTGAMDWTGGSILRHRRRRARRHHDHLRLRVLTTGTIDNAGTVTWSGSGYIETSSRAVWNNLAGSTFDAQGDGQFSGDTTTAFNNDGTFTKSVGAATGATTFYGVTFTNAGVVEISAGNLSFTGAYTQESPGSTFLDDNTLSATGGVSIQGGSLSGPGTIKANVTNSGQVSPGDEDVPGDLAIIGNYTQTATGTLNINIGGLAPLYDQLSVSGTGLRNPRRHAERQPDRRFRAHRGQYVPDRDLRFKFGEVRHD